MTRIAKLILLLFLTFLITSIRAQTISGVVRGADDGQTLPGVSILIKGTSQGTATDVNGRYNIDVPGKQTVLIFSFIGYSTTELQVGNRATIDVLLAPEARRLEVVLVTALGVKREKREIG